MTILTADAIRTFKPKMVRVIATKTGYDNIKLREEGEEFVMPDTTLVAVVKKAADGSLVRTGEMEVVPVTGSWFVPVGDEPAKAKKTAKADADKKADDLA